MSSVSLVCLILHPTIDPHLITNTLSLKPYMIQKSGDQVRTLKGALIDGSFYKFSRWNHIIEISKNDSLEYQLEVLIDRFIPHINFLHTIINEGGRIEIFFSIATKEDDTRFLISQDLINKMSMLKVSFGFELV